MRWLALLFAGSVAVGSPLQAETASGTIAVSLEVLPACRVQTAPLAFSASAGDGAEAQTPIEVKCTSDTEVAIALDGGRQPDGATRQLAGPDGTLVPYGIFTDPARTQLWSTGSTWGSVGAAEPLRLVAYGKVEGSATVVPAGFYHDTVTVTVTF